MAKVPDLGTDFAQKLLKDLRQRRERLGFESTNNINIVPRDAYSNSQKPHKIRNPQQAAPQGGRAESTTNKLYQKSNNSTDGARTRHNHGAPPIAHSQAIVPFQGGGSKPKPAANVDVDMQMALALTLSNRGKLQNIQFMESNGGNYLLSPGGKVSVGVQKLNDILMAYTSGASMRSFGKRGSVEVGKQLLRGAMDLEESWNMLMMLQEASDYMGSSGNGKVLLLEGKEARRSASRSPSSARLVDIVDEDSEAELGSVAKNSSDASMQIVPLRKSQCSSANHRSALQLTTVTNSSKSKVTSGAKDDSKVRMPNLIAKLMGLENLPSVKVVAEHKATERFVKPDAVPRKAATTDATFGTLPMRIVHSEGVASKGQIKNLMAREWNISLTKSEESECGAVLSSRPPHLTADKKARQTMRQVFSKQESTDRRLSVTQAVDEKIVHQGMKLTGESKLQKTVDVGCCSDRKMNFLQRFRKNAKSKPVTEEKGMNQENNRKPGKMQATGRKQSGIDREVKPRIGEKFNKGNLSSADNTPGIRNGKTDQLRRQAQSKQTNKQIVEKRLQNYRQIQNETASQILEHKRSVKSEARHTKENIEHTILIKLKNGECTKVDNTRGRKPSSNTPSDDAIFRQSAAEMKSTSTTRGVSPDQSEKQLPEEIKDPTTSVAQTSACSTADTTVNGVNRTASEAIRMVEIFSEGEQQQQLQRTKYVDDLSGNGNDFDNITKSGNPADLENHNIDVMLCDSFTETQFFLKEMLLKDHYLLETAKSITRVHEPVSAAHVNTGKWLDKGNQVLSDIGREVLRRKGKRTEAMVDVSMARPATLRLQTLDDLVRELDADIQSLDTPSMKPHQQRDNSTGENLKMVLHSDIENAHPGANSVWDFGWIRMRDLPIEINDVVKGLERNILGSVITDVARELIDVLICHGWCACEA